MQAIIQTGGKQYTVAKGDDILVELLDADVGKTVQFEDVLLVTGESGTQVGTPHVKGAVVKAEVLAEVKGVKTRAVKFRRRKDSKTVKGHRQQYHRVRITSIDGV